jgi:hypothetical protein
MSDRREMFTSIGKASSPQVEIALRLQVGDPHDAPRSAATKPGNKSFSVTFGA